MNAPAHKPTCLVYKNRFVATAILTTSCVEVYWRTNALSSFLSAQVSIVSGVQQNATTFVRGEFGTTGTICAICLNNELS